jgi:hypothetical protein
MPCGTYLEEPFYFALLVASIEVKVQPVSAHELL